MQRIERGRGAAWLRPRRGVLPAALLLGLLAVLAAGLLALLPGRPAMRAAAPPDSAAAMAAPRILRMALQGPEAGFDPARVADAYSRAVLANIFEAPLEYAWMAEPVQLRPRTAQAMPEVSADHRTITVRITPGIHFADDPAFGGRPRELTAADYVYAIKRLYDPRINSPSLYVMENAGLLGLSELRQAALVQHAPFDYDHEVAGLQALDRYTLRLRFATPQPRFIYHLADGTLTGAVAREVVAFYGDAIDAHPVGTGPYRLDQWTRSARIALRRNPGYRRVPYDEQPPAGDTRLQAVAQRLHGRPLPLNDGIDFSVVAEGQPRWLSFLRGDQDLLEDVPAEVTDLAAPAGRLAPFLQRRGVQMLRYLRADVTLTYFAMEHPLVGGYTPPKVALRRAIALAMDVDTELRLLRGGQGVRAQSLVAPHTGGHDPAFFTEMGDFDLPRARALLDLYGYVDRDGDGWREQPDGAPLLLVYTTQPGPQMRRMAELWQRNLAALGLRVQFRFASFQENLKASRAGRLMMWSLTVSATTPDATGLLERAYGPNSGQANHARFRLPAYDELHRRQRSLPDGPERAALLHEQQRLLVAYMPYKAHVHRIYTDLAQPWVQGYHRNVFVRDFWKYLDVDTAVRDGGLHER